MLQAKIRSSFSLIIFSKKVGPFGPIPHQLGLKGTGQEIEFKYFKNMDYSRCKSDPLMVFEL